MSTHTNGRMTVTVVKDAPRARRVGFGRVLGLALLSVVLMLTASCSSLPFSGGKMEVTAYFEDSAGLFVGNDVGILGVTVGKITSIEPDGDQVKVTMEVDDDYDVPADAGAVVVARSVATDRYVELTPVYRKGPKMEDGAEIDAGAHPDARRLRPGPGLAQRVRDRHRRFEEGDERDPPVHQRRRRDAARATAR